MDVLIDLNAVIVSVDGDRPQVLTVPHAEAGGEAGLPFGPFDPQAHRTLELGLRTWVEEQTRLPLGYVEQLYTFGDRGRHGPGEDVRVVSVGYLALTRAAPRPAETGARWADWYAFLPWEDWRKGPPALIAERIAPALDAWATDAPTPARRERRRARINACFGGGGFDWDEERVLDRYELLYEAGLVRERARDDAGTVTLSGPSPLGADRPMPFDHRRILATAIGRLRAKLKYRPVVFELMPATFTLLELQRCVEAVTGAGFHKQNFRRYVERSGLVEPTGAIVARGPGRPAAEHRFKREALLERPATGVRISPTLGPR